MWVHWKDAHLSFSVPQLLVALPATPRLDFPASRLLGEWAISLDPVGILREAARQRLVSDEMTEKWAISTCHAVPSGEAMNWMRMAARDERTVGSFRASRARLVDEATLDAQGRASTRRLADLTEWDPDLGSEVLAHGALPVVVGLAILSMIDAPIGPAGHVEPPLGRQ